MHTTYNDKIHFYKLNDTLICLARAINNTRLMGLSEFAVAGDSLWLDLILDELHKVIAYYELMSKRKFDTVYSYKQKLKVEDIMSICIDYCAVLIRDVERFIRDKEIYTLPLGTTPSGKLTDQEMDRLIDYCSQLILRYNREKVIIDRVAIDKIKLNDVIDFIIF